MASAWRRRSGTAQSVWPKGEGAVRDWGSGQLPELGRSGQSHGGGPLEHRGLLGGGPGFLPGRFADTEGGFLDGTSLPRLVYKDSTHCRDAHTRIAPSSVCALTSYFSERTIFSKRSKPQGTDRTPVIQRSSPLFRPLFAQTLRAAAAIPPVPQGVVELRLWTSVLSMPSLGACWVRSIACYPISANREQGPRCRII